MTRSKSFTVDNFTGIDRRYKLYAMPPKALYVGENVEITRGGVVKTRDKLVVEAQLPANTIGLYEAGGKLRCAAPAGNGLAAQAPLGFVFDEISPQDAGAVSTTRYVAVRGNTTWSADKTGNPFPYIVMETVNGAFEHHYVDGVNYNTRVGLPFAPGQSLVKQSGKIHAPSSATGVLHSSSTLIGPRVWDFEAGSAGENDASAVDVINFAAGDPRVKGLSYGAQNQIVVFFRDSMQFWIVDPNPAAFQYQRTLAGPGTDYFGSVAPVKNDLYFFGDGGFQSTQASLALGETREGNVGAEVFDITRSFNDGSYTVNAIWSEYRSQYICFFSKGGATTAFVYTLSPLGGVDAWCTWTLDMDVEYVAERDTVLYLRSGDTVYRFDETAIGDDLGYTATVETPMYNGGDARALKRWQSVELNQEGTVDTLSFRSDTTDTTKIWVGARNITGPTAPRGMIPIVGMSHNLGLKFETTKHWELSSLTLDFLDLSGAG